MARDVIKKLTEREVMLVVQGAQRVEAAQQAHQNAQAGANMAVSQYFESLELLTGDEEPHPQSRTVRFRGVLLDGQADGETA